MMESQHETRRDFLKKSTLAMGAMYTSSAFDRTGIASLGSSQQATLPVSKLKKPVAIAMWDYSWILRHHRYGSFENWDKTLEVLAERGYNAIRMDAMPQFVAADTNGEIQHELDWKWIKESAEICVDLTKKHDNYKFICTSNFTHPQFVGMWEDITWHRKITSIIKS